MTQIRPSIASNEPYCGNCGYALTGLTESSKCPECGKPLVEVLTRPSNVPNFGKRYRSKATLFGLPVIDIALGPKDGQMRGKAKGIIAVGDVAFGGIALGGAAFGVVAIGGLTGGLFCVGGLALGLLTAIGGFAVGAVAVGGGAVGVLASGGGAIGYAAQGGGALGIHVRDGRSFRGTASPAIFEQLSWFFGAWPPRGASIWQPMLIAGGLVLATAAMIGAVAVFRLMQDPDE